MKQLAFIIAALAASSAFASGLTFTGDVGATSNEIYRGHSLSNKNPAADVDARVDADAGPVGIFGSVHGNTVNFGDQRALARTSLGASLNLFGINAEVGLRQNSNFGGLSSELNNREAFVRAAAPMLGGIVSAEYNKQVQGATEGYGYPSYTAIGYHFKPLTNLTLGTSIGYAGYRIGHKVNDVTLSAKYNLTSKVDLLAGESIGEKNADGSEIPNYTSVGLRYSF